MRRRSAIVLLVSWLVLVLLAGCSKITLENYDKIETGMTYAEVVAILGPPDEVNDVIGTRSAAWKDGDKMISIKFVADKVIFHSAKGLD